MAESDQNPLNRYEQKTAFHILVGFEFSTAAYKFDYRSNVGKVGESVSADCGTAKVFMNELKDSSVQLDRASTIWDFYSTRSPMSNDYVGNIELLDRSGTKFDDTMKSLIGEVETSLFHITFMWVTAFRVKRDGKPTENLYSAPMYFHVSNEVHDVNADLGRSYFFDIVSCYNTHARSTQFLNITGNTITHKDGATINTIPTPVAGGGGIISNLAETSAKFSPRKDRLDKSKVMKTMEDFCQSFELCLMEARKKHKNQLQEYLSLTRNNDYVKKLDGINDITDPMVEYVIKCDPYYKGKKIDNRNLPFEQYEVDQNIAGISSITFPFGSNIHSALYQVFKSSKDIAADHASPIGCNTFKFVTATERKCNSKYKIHTNIYKYKSPYNSEGANTGPGDGVVDKPLEFTYQEVEKKKDTNVMSITIGKQPAINFLPIEKTAKEDESDVVFGDRELQSVNREIKGINFFEYGYTGIRNARGILTDNGLEDSETASHLTNYSPTQQITYTITIVGNPDLYSDINRNPDHVIEHVEGNPVIYKFTEYEPMYIKLKIYLGGDQRNSDTGVYYFDNYVHLYRVENIFTGGGDFIQRLHCGRTDTKA